jgi:hypothetical protein
VSDLSLSLSLTRSINSFVSLESQLQMAIINQMYYNDKNPEQIFGNVRMDLAQEMVDSIELWNTELPFFYSSDLPSNFV